MPPVHPETRISDPRTYQLKLLGSVDEEFIRSFCPAGLSIHQEEDILVVSHIVTDQSGIIGLIRGLHNLGCIIIKLHTF